MVQAAVADSVDSSPTDVELSSGDSMSAPPSAVSDTLECLEECRRVEGPEEQPTSVHTPASVPGDATPPEADPRDSSAATDNRCSDTSSAESLTKVEKSVDHDMCSGTNAGDQSIPAEQDEANDIELSTHTAGDLGCRNETSSCNELSSSLTDSLDICEQGVIGSLGDGSVLAADSEAGTAAVSEVLTNECTSKSGHCDSATSTIVVNDGPSAGSPEFENQSTAGCRCLCDVDEPRQSLPQLETASFLSESSHPLNRCDPLPSDSEQDLTVSAASEASRPSCGDEADIIPISSLDVHDLHTSTSLLSAANVCQITSGVEMETELEAVGRGLPLTDGSGNSPVAEPDCEPGGKASKLDRPLVAECSTGSDLEACDTGALHMSVGFQPAPDDDEVATSDGDSDASHDSSIGVLMVCDDDGLVASISAMPSIIMAESSEDSSVASSSSDGDYESLVADIPPASVMQLSEETNAEKWSSEGDRVDTSSTESSAAVAVSNVMLYEVDSRSQEMNELLADVSQTGISTGHDASLTSTDTSVFLHEDGELRCHVACNALLRPNLVLVCFCVMIMLSVLLS